MTMTDSAVATAPYDELTAALRGRLVRPGDPDYDEARAVYNAMIDRRPAAIVQCRDAADVITAVRFARVTGSRSPCAAAATTRPASASVTTRSSSTCPPMHGVRVDPERRHRACRTAAALWADVDHATRRASASRRPAGSSRPPAWAA